MPETIRILLVDDNPGDVELAREHLEACKVLVELHVASDGIEALGFLHREGDFANAPRPHLVLLDLNLPGKDGRQVLAEMKADPLLRRIPVVVLTSSKAEGDILKSYELNVSAYVSKPVDLEGFAKIVQGLEGFWFSIVHFPEQG